MILHYQLMRFFCLWITHPQRITAFSAAFDDGYRVFSVRIKVDTFDHINELAEETGRTRNELIGMLLDFALEHSEVAGERA